MDGKTSCFKAYYCAAKRDLPKNARIFLIGLFRFFLKKTCIFPKEVL